jgi:hypothetical protein
MTDIIFNETVLIPELLAENALRECEIPRNEKWEQYIPKLVNRLEFHYMNNPNFKKELKGRDGKAYSEMFMIHWIKGGYLTSTQTHETKMPII